MKTLFLLDAPDGGGFLILFLLGFALIFSLIPYWVAGKKHPYRNQILLICIFLGWTLIGWVGALIWATMPSKTPKDDTREVY